MKRIVKKSIKDENGQALILVVILMLLGSLIIAPLLGFMSTGLIVGQVFEKKMGGLYAADAGIEDAMWKLLNGYYLPPHNLTDVNGMDVTVVELGQEPITDGTLYTLQSTAYLGGEVKAEIIAQVEAVTEGAVAGGGTGGDYSGSPEMRALSLIDEDSIIFTTQQPNARFQGWGDTDFTEINPWDLASLNMATGKAHLFLDGDLVMTDPKYYINGVHYYQDGGLDYLVMLVRDNDTVGTQTFSNSDIIRLQVDVAVNNDDPDYPYPYISAVNSIQLFDTIEGANLIALSRRDDGTILFSLHTDAILDGTQFYRGEVIEYDPVGGTHTSLFNTKDIIPDNPNLELDALAVLPAPDERLLLSFTVNSVTGSNGVLFNSEDIAIWDMGPDGIANTADDTINLHISMSGMVLPGPATTVNIVSWEIS